MWIIALAAPYNHTLPLDCDLDLTVSALCVGVGRIAEAILAAQLLLDFAVDLVERLLFSDLEVSAAGLSGDLLQVFLSIRYCQSEMGSEDLQVICLSKPSSAGGKSGRSLWRFFVTNVFF